MTNVLMTGAGAPGGPGIIRALKADAETRLFTADADPLASGRFIHEPFFHIPKATSPDFIDALLQLCIREKINVLFPLVTMELFALSKHKQEFKDAGISVIVSDTDGLETANDKGKLYTHLASKNIITPVFRIVKNAAELEAAARSLGYPERPVCIKPCVSNGSRGVRILTKDTDAFDLLFNHKPQNLYITLEQIMDIIREREIPEILVSEYLPGEEYTIDTIVQKGIPKIIIPRLRSKMNGGISVAGRFENNTEIIAYCEQILLSLDLHGPIGLQVKKGADGAFKILEINPRIQGTSVAAIGAGINLPLVAVNQEVSAFDYASLKMNWNIGFSRFYEEVFYTI